MSSSDEFSCPVFKFGNATVKFLTDDEDQVFTKSYKFDDTIKDVKASLIDKFSLNITYITIKLGDEVLNDNTVLSDLPTDEYNVIELNIKSKNTTKLIETVYKDVDVVPDILTVKVQTSTEGIKDVIVEVEDRKIVKPHIGGYKDRILNKEYEHGYSQTGPPDPKVSAQRKRHRCTQTYDKRNRKVDMMYSQGTQMYRHDLFIPNITDKILKSNPYETAEELEKRIDIAGKVRTTQRYFKAYKLVKCLKEYSAEYKTRIQKQLENERRIKQEDEERRKKDIISKVFPYTDEDFSMLYTMLEKWKKGEQEQINSKYCGAAKITQLYMLLEKECEMLKSIDKLKRQVSLDVKVQRTINFFKKIGTPIKWNSNYKNVLIKMDTLETQKGREYSELFEKMCDRTYNRQDRINALLDVKVYFADHNCEIKQEMFHLIDRACELLARNFEPKYLRTLQQRIESMLFYHIKTPACNYGVTNRINRVKEKLMENSLFYCQRCNKLKEIDEFTVNARIDCIRICKTCNWIDKANSPWVDYSPYRFIIQQIRRYERSHNSPSSICFIMQDKDLHHIITVIWHGHSALSECNDIYQLQLCRWKKEENWSPWNCILLTFEEASAHLNVDDLKTVYEKEFMNHIFNKHALAKKHFAHLINVEKSFKKLSKKDTRLDGTVDFTRMIAVSSKTKIYYTCH